MIHRTARRSSRGYSFIELLVVMGIISMILLIAAPVLMRFSSRHKCYLAAEQFIGAFNHASIDAANLRTPVMLVLDADDDGRLRVQTWQWFYKRENIDTLNFDYHAKNYDFALGDTQGSTDPAKRPPPLRETLLPAGVAVGEGKYPGQAGHWDDAVQKYLFVYPDPSGRYRMSNDPILLFNSRAEDPKDRLIPADRFLFGGDPNDPSRPVTHWIDLNPDGGIDDGSGVDTIPIKFVDPSTGEWAEAEIHKMTHVVKVFGASAALPNLPAGKFIYYGVFAVAGLAVMYFLIVLVAGVIKRVRE
jgi:prepilin-type N-terminal cleavage/methylation domain-containing protein